MAQIIQNKIFTIYGKPGTGKTFFATMLASAYRRIYANVEIRRHGKIVSNRIENIADLEHIHFSPIKGIVIIDEGGVNVNARQSMSEGNMEFGKLGMLGRKKNVDIIVISQLERMTDVYFRELSTASFKMRSWYVSADKLMFDFSLLDADGNDQWTKFVDLFEWSKKT